MPTAKECATIDAKWSVGVKNIIATKCAISGCHDGITKEDDFTTYDKLKPHASHALSEINSGAMPKDGITLSTSELQQLQCWLDAGAPNN